MNYDHLTDKEKTDLTFTAIFGDGNGDPGMKDKLDKMFTVFSGATFGATFIKNTIIFLGTLATVGYVVYKILTKQSPF